MFATLTADFGVAPPDLSCDMTYRASLTTDYHTAAACATMVMTSFNSLLLLTLFKKYQLLFFPLRKSCKIVRYFSHKITFSIF